MDINLRTFDEAFRVLQAGAFRAGVQHPRVEQHRQYGIKVVSTLVALLYLLAYLVETKFVVDFLKEKIAAVEAALHAFLHKLPRIVLYNHLLPVFLLRNRQLRDVLLGFADGILSSKADFEVFEGTKALNVLGPGFSVFITETLLYIICGLLAHGHCLENHIL
ncbi:MAG: hypothetical protein ACI4I0_08005 [Acutalibacteraceae bacterium]